MGGRCSKISYLSFSYGENISKWSGNENEYVESKIYPAPFDVCNYPLSGCLADNV